MGGGSGTKQVGYSTLMITAHCKPFFFFFVIPPNITIHKTCCCQLCFADVEGVSEPPGICLIFTITELEAEM